MSEHEVDVLKLHPMTLLQRVILSLPGYAALLLATWTSPDEGNLVSLVVTVIYAVIALPIIYLRYSRFSYWITDTELVIKSGVLTRQHRNIPLDKIQNVEILQKLLPRLTGTAQVQVVTAGSAGAEGVLEFVSLKEAHRIREVVRRYNHKKSVVAPTVDDPGIRHSTASASSLLGGEAADTSGDTDPSSDRNPDHEASVTSAEVGQRNLSPPGPFSSEPVIVGSAAAFSLAEDDEHSGREPLYAMSIRRVLLSGVFRFSLLYIALIFSALQFFQPDPEKLLSWVLRNSYDPFVHAIRDSPLSSALLGVVGAAILSWISGIAVNFNKYFGFKLWKNGAKLGKRSGLLTLTEGSIPLRKIQAILFESNPIREAIGFNSMRVQTMGLDSNEAGHRVIVPFARVEETDKIARSVVPWTMPDRYTSVSPKRIMRLFVRYTISLLGLIGVLSTWYPKSVWLVFLTPLLFGVAYAQWKQHGYAFVGDALGVRRGVIKRRTWLLPVSKMQVFYSTDSFFQRRRGLKSVYVDSAGASSVSRPVVIDLDGADADELVRQIYASFRLQD